MMLCDGQMFTPLIATAEPLLSVFKEADEAGNPYASLHFDLDELQYLRHEREKAGDVEYWIPKLQKNVDRDKQTDRLLANTGWSVVTIWECEVKNGEYINILSKTLPI